MMAACGGASKRSFYVLLQINLRLKEQERFSAF
jgi:hypothetical protein